MERQFYTKNHSLKQIMALVLISATVVFIYGVAARTYLSHGQPDASADSLASLSVE